MFVLVVLQASQACQLKDGPALESANYKIFPSSLTWPLASVHSAHTTSTPDLHNMVLSPCIELKCESAAFASFRCSGGSQQFRCFPNMQHHATDILKPVVSRESVQTALATFNLYTVCTKLTRPRFPLRNILSAEHRIHVRGQWYGPDGHKEAPSTFDEHLTKLENKFQPSI